MNFVNLVSNLYQRSQLKNIGAIFICINVFCVCKISAQELIQVGLQKQLLVDDYVISEKQNITRELGKPQKMGVVMEPTFPTDFESVEQLPDGSIIKNINYEFGRRLSVVWNDQRQLFQMLYGTSGGGTGYAESRDGTKWTKPLISEDGKSNLITFRGKTLGTFYESTFMIDPTIPWSHPEKFKAAYNPGNVQCAIAHSADGIHWTGYNFGNSVTGRAADTHNQILWDSFQNRYMLLTRTDLGDMGDLKESRASRIMVHNNGNNLLKYPMAWKTIAVINVDDPDHEVTKAGVPVYQMESMKIWEYENIYFGLMHVLTAGELTGAEGRVAVPDPDKRPDTDVIDFYIGTSRNGKDFDKNWIYAKKPFVPRGPAYSFDKAILEPSSEIITRGDEHFIFYTGLYSQHHSPTSAKKESGKVGLAKLPMDRFVSYSANNELGTITTKPFKLEGSTLQVNVDAQKGRFYVEVLDTSGKPIPGFSANKAKIFEGVDQLRLQPQWKNDKDISLLKGKTILLKFYLENAKLYAFQIKNDNSSTDKNKTFSTHVWKNSDKEYTKYRIPSIIVTQKGTVLIFCEGRAGDGGDSGDIDLLVKRSSDNGKTWSEQSIVWDDGGNTCGNPCPVIDQSTGRIILMMTWNSGSYDEDEVNRKEDEDTRRPFTCYSDDDGLTWSEPVDLTAMCKNPVWEWYATGPGIGIQLKSEKYKNRIVIPANHSYYTNNEAEWGFQNGIGLGSHVLLSDDGGATWRYSESITPRSNESQVVELSDGRLMMNMRSYNKLRCRAVSYSDDGGETWSDIEHALQLVEPVCQASIIEYGQYNGDKMYLFTNPASVEDRVYMTIKTSFDNCKTWSNAKLIADNKAEYSCLTVLPNGNIGLIYEVGRVEEGWADKGLMFVSVHPDELFTPGTLLKSDQLPK